MSSMYVSGGSVGTPDGSVVITASMDTGEIRRAAEEITKIFSRMRENTARQSAALRGSVTAEAARGAASVLSTAETLNRRIERAITVGGSGILHAAGGVMGEALSAMLSRSGTFTEVGVGMMRHVAAGISSSAAITDAAARAAAQSALRTMQNELGMAVTASAAVGTSGKTNTQTAASQRRTDYPITGETVLRASGVIGSQMGSAAAVSRSTAAAGGTAVSAASEKKQTGNTNMTVVFTKPVETPAAHAKALKRTMEDMLYK